MSISASYNNLTLHIVPGPRSLSYFLPFLLLYLALLIPRSVLSQSQVKWVVLPVVYSIQLYIWLSYDSFDVISMNNTLVTFMLLGLYDVRKDFKYVRRKHVEHKREVDTNTSKQNTGSDKLSSSSMLEETSYPQALWPRMKWSLILMFSLRLNDWHIGSPAHDIRQPSTTYLFNLIPVNAVADPAPFHLSNLSSIYAVPTKAQSKFGLRAFWGTFWHQNMRYMTSAPGIALSSWLQLPSDSINRYTIVVSSSFFWSGIVHMGVIPPEPLNTSYGVLRLRLQLASFFWLQIIGVAIELFFQNMLLFHGKAGVEKSDHKEITKHKSKASVNFLDSFTLRLLWGTGVFLWTASFLAITAWWTIYPVGREVNWWGLTSVPFTLYLI